VLKVFLFKVCLVVLLLAELSGCGVGDSAERTPPRRLILTGSSTVAPLAAEIALRFEEQNPATQAKGRNRRCRRKHAETRYYRATGSLL